jgi:hypothetical protein
MNDSHLYIYPRRRDTGSGGCPYFINLEYAVCIGLAPRAPSLAGSDSDVTGFDIKSH